MSEEKDSETSQEDRKPESLEEIYESETVNIKSVSWNKEVPTENSKLETTMESHQSRPRSSRKEMEGLSV